MARSLPPKSERKSSAPDLPPELKEALAAARQDPSSDEAWDNLEEVCRDLDRPEEAAALFGEVLDGDAPVDVRVEVGRRAADFHEEWFEDTEYVVEVLQKVLEIDRSARWAFDRLSLLLTVSARWEDLLGEYDRALQACADQSERVGLLEEVARVARDFAGESHRANDYLKELLLLKPDDDQLAANLERRLDHAGSHADLIEVWRARLSVLTGEAALNTHAQIGARYLDALKDPEAALEAVASLLRASEEQSGQGEDAAIGLLDRLSETESAAVEVRRQALGTLKALHAKAARNDQIVDVLRRSLALAEDDDSLLALHREVCELLTQIDRKSEALGHAAEILLLAPGTSDIHDAARSLAEDTGEQGRYAAALVAAGDAAKDSPTLAVQLFVEAATLQKSTLGDAPAAIELFSRVLAHEGVQPTCERLATRELTELLVEDGHRAQRLDVLEKRARLEDDEAVVRGLLGEAATLADTLGDVDRALGLWQRRVDAQKSDIEALSARVDLLERAERWEELLGDLSLRAERTDGDAARGDLVKIAALCANQIGDLERAISAWKTIEKRFGRNEETVDAMVALGSRAGRWDDVVGLLTEVLETEASADRRLVQHTLLGDALREHAGDTDGAIQQYRGALAIEPTHAEARAGLRAMFDDEEAADPACDALAQALTAADEWQAKVDLLETRLSAAPTDTKRRDLLLEAARLHEGRGENAGAALTAVARAFALLPEASTEVELLRLAGVTGDYRTARDSYAGAIERLGATSGIPKGDPEVAARCRELFAAKGHIEEEQLQNPGEATNSYRWVVQSAPEEEQDAVVSLLRVAIRSSRMDAAAWGFVEFCRALDVVPRGVISHVESLVGEAGAWDEMTHAVATELKEHAGLSEVVARELDRQLAVWHRDQRQDDDAAEKVLRHSVEVRADAESLSMLADLQRKNPGRPLVVTLIALAEATGHALGPMQEAARVALDSVKDLELATPILERAMTHAKAAFIEAGELGEGSEVAAWCRERLVAAALEDGKTERAIGLLVGAASLPYPAQDQIDLRFRAAEVAATLPDDSQAVELCQGILEEQENHGGAIQLLSSLHERAGRLEALLELKRRELLLEAPVEHRLGLRLEMASVLGKLERPIDERVEVVRANLAESPGHAASVNGLIELLTEAEDHAALAQDLSEQADAVARGGEPERASRLWAHVGRLADNELRDVERALAAYRSSVRLSPDVKVLDRLAEICDSREEYSAEVGWLEQRLELTPDAAAADDQMLEERRTTVVRLAEARVHANEEARAREGLVAALEDDPGADGARRVLSRLYRELEDWEALGPLLAGGVEYAPDVEGRIEYLRGAAQIERRHLGNLERAIPLLEEAVSLDPDDRSLRLQLADCLRLAERYDEARELLTALLEEFGRRRTTERATVHHHLARIAQATGDYDTALEQAEAAAKIERTDPAILMLVGQVARQKGQLERAEQAYRTLLLIVSRKSPGTQSSDEGDAVGESEILFELYGIASRMGEEDRARDLLDSALEVATRNPSEAARLDEALREAGQSDLLLEALDQRLTSTTDAAAAAPILLTKAQILARSGRADEAFKVRLAALERTPSDARLVEGTRKLAEEIGTIERFIQHLSLLAEARAQTEPKVACEIWLRLGGYLDADEPVRAADLYERAQESGHRPIQSFAALDRVLRRLKDQERTRRSLTRFVQAEGAASNPEALAQALERLAHYELADGNVEGAAEHLSRGLELGGSDKAVLELLMPSVMAGASSKLVVDLFLRVARTAGDEGMLLIALSLAAEQADADLELLREAVELARRQDDDGRLEALLERAIEVARASDTLVDARWALIELSSRQEAAGGHRKAAELLRETIALSGGDLVDDETYELELRFANITAGPLDDLSSAARSYERLLDVRGDDTRVWKPLLAVYRRGGRTDDLTALIDRIEPEITSDDERRTLRMERIRLMIDAGDLEPAETELRALIDEADDEEATAILADLLEKAGRREELRDLLEALFDRARGTEDPEIIGRAALRLARLVEDDDRPEAISVLVASLSWTNSHREVLTHLLGLYDDDDDLGDRADATEYLLALETGDDAAVLCAELIAFRRQLDDEYGVGRALELGFKACPDSEPMARQLFDWLREQEDFNRLAEMLMLDGERAQDPALAIERFEEASALFDENLGDPMQAASALERAFALEPTNLDRLEKMTGFLAAVGEIERAIAAIGRAIDAGGAGTLPLLRMRADIRSREFGDDIEPLAKARQDLETAYELTQQPDWAAHGPAVRSELLTVLGRLVTLYGDIADEPSQREVLLRRAEVMVSTDDSFQALELLASWLRDHTFDTTVAERLGQMASAVEDWGTATFAYARLFEASEGDARRSASLRFADAAERAGTAMAARGALEAVYRENPDDSELAERMRQMYEAAGAYVELADILLADVEATDDDDRKIELLCEAGDLFLKAEVGGAAIDVFERALALRPEALGLQAKLADGLIVQGEVERAAQVLQEAVEAHGKRRSPELSMLQHGLARVARAQGDSEAHLNWLEAALLTDRQNGDVAAELAVAAQEQGNLDAAVKALQLITLLKKPGPMSKAEAYLRQAQIAVEQGDPRKALLLARRSASADPALDDARTMVTQLGG